MRKCTAFLTVLFLLLFAVTTVFAANGNVTYNGSAREFVFEPGSNYSPTDLFPDFKSVMPGDTLTQRIILKNDPAKKVKVKLYLRSSYVNETSEDFLSKLQLSLTESNENGLAYMFDEAGSLTRDNDGWIFLGTLYSGGEVELNVDLKVPVTLGNEYSDKVGYINWEFRADEEMPGPSDPEPPKTGEQSVWEMTAALMLVSGAVVLVLISTRKKHSAS